MVTQANIQNHIVDYLGQSATFLDNQLEKYTDWSLIKLTKTNLLNQASQERFDNTIPQVRWSQKAVATATITAAVALSAIWMMPSIASVATFQSLGLGAIGYTLMDTESEKEFAANASMVSAVVFGAMRAMPSLALGSALLLGLSGAFVYGCIETAIHTARAELPAAIARRNAELAAERQTSNKTTR